MKLEFVCKNYTAPDKLKEVITKKLEKLTKYFDGESVKCKVLLKQEKDRQTVEITIFANKVIRSEVTGLNMYDIIDVILPKLERQIIKFRTLAQDKHKKGGIRAEEREYFNGDLPQHDGAIVRTKSYTLSPISVEEAIQQLELLDHSFYVFLNEENNTICVAYRREHGQYGIIEANRN